MSTQRFAPAFKEEAVRQVLTRGYSVAEVSARLGVQPTACTSGSRLQRPTRPRKAAELLEAKSEILRCGHRCVAWKKSDFLKKPRGALPGSPSKVPLHKRASSRSRHDVPGVARGTSRILSVVA